MLIYIENVHITLMRVAVFIVKSKNFHVDN